MIFMRLAAMMSCLLLILPMAQSQQATGPVIENGQAQVVDAFNTPTNWIREDLWVETSFDSDKDGDPDRMHVDVTRPPQTENGLKLPVIYVSSPYFAGVARDDGKMFWNVEHELGEDAPEERSHPPVQRRGQRPVISHSHIMQWVPRGFIVVHSSSPGTGLSDGSPTIGGDNESLAPKAVIDWLNGRARGYKTRTGDEEVKAYWTTGKVGMTGTSYNGTIPLAAATTGVEGLEAIIPIAPNTSYYHYYRSNGLVRSPSGYLGEDVDVLYDFVHSGAEENREGNNKRIRDSVIMQGIDRKTGDYNEFWASRDYLNDMEGMKAALFMSHGFNDWNVMPEHSYRIYKKAEEMGLPTKIYYHQQGHGGPPPFEMMNKWFTKYLFGEDNGIDQAPKAYIVRENAENNNPTPYEDYPNPQAETVTFYLEGGAPEYGNLTLDKPASQRQETIVDNYSFSGSTLANAEYTDHRLLFLSPKLQESIHLSGLSNMNIRLASSKPAANLSVWLVSMPWEQSSKAKITDNIITRGWADPQNSESLTESEPLQPGTFYELSFSLQPDDQVIPKGQQIGLLIFSTDREFTLWPEPGTELTVDLEHTSLELPVVGGKQAFEKAIASKE